MKYGAKGGKWAKMMSEGTTTVKPTYGEAMAFEGLNEFDETLNMATGSAHGDNKEMIYISEFSNGEGTVKAVYIPAELASAVLGTQVDDENGMAYRTEDNQPLGAYGFYRTLIDPRKNKYYEVNFFPKVQGSVEGSNSKTKENGVTLEYEAIKFRILACNHGDYKIEKRFRKENEAIAYLEGLFAGTAKWPSEDGQEATPPGQEAGNPGNGNSGTEGGDSNAGSTEGNGGEDTEVVA